MKDEAHNAKCMKQLIEAQTKTQPHLIQTTDIFLKSGQMALC